MLSGLVCVSKTLMLGAGQLSTELTISADEFENYDIFTTPISLAFHLREFNVSFLLSCTASPQRCLPAVWHLPGNDSICRVDGGSP